jgi:hypothetical protein
LHLERRPFGPPFLFAGVANRFNQSEKTTAADPDDAGKLKF